MAVHESRWACELAWEGKPVIGSLLLVEHVEYAGDVGERNL